MEQEQPLFLQPLASWGLASPTSGRPSNQPAAFQQPISAGLAPAFEPSEIAPSSYGSVAAPFTGPAPASNASNASMHRPMFPPPMFASNSTVGNSSASLQLPSPIFNKTQQRRPHGDPSSLAGVLPPSLTAKHLPPITFQGHPSNLPAVPTPLVHPAPTHPLPSHRARHAPHARRRPHGRLCPLHSAKTPPCGAPPRRPRLAQLPRLQPTRLECPTPARHFTRPGRPPPLHLLRSGRYARSSLGRRRPLPPAPPARSRACDALRALRRRRGWGWDGSRDSLLPRQSTDAFTPPGVPATREYMGAGGGGRGGAGWRRRWWNLARGRGGAAGKGANRSGSGGGGAGDAFEDSRVHSVSQLRGA